MRNVLPLAALVAALGASVLPVRTASAYCDPVLFGLTGRCNVCEIVNPGGPCPD